MENTVPILLILLPPFIVWAGFYYWTFKQDKKNRGIPVGISILRMFAARNLIFAIIFLGVLIWLWIMLIGLLFG